jgi:putative flippase GtrA
MLRGQNKKNTARQLSSFTVVGLIQYVLDAALVYALLFGGIELIIASLLSRTVVGFAGFYVNRSITFRDTDVDFLTSFLKFLLAWVATTILSTLGIMLAITLFVSSSSDPLLGMLVKLVIEAIVFVVAFFIQKFWIFKT